VPRQICALRQRQKKNMLATLLWSQGTPMITAGDEFGRTQRGNNNAYSQDNAISWFDWRLVETRRSMLRFVREAVALRHRHPCLTANRFFHGRPVPGRDLPDVTWHGARLHAPGWGDPNGRMLAFTIAGTGGEEDLHVILNMAEAAIDVELPQIADRTWHVAIDTARESPFDVVERARQVPYPGPRYRTSAHSVVALEAR
jgi:glycogen operon protein